MAIKIARLLGLVLLLGLIECSTSEADMEARLEELTQELSKMSEAFSQLSRQVMLQQLFIEERIRSDGGSGIKQTRQSTQGTLPYHSNTAVGGEVASIHNHPNEIRSVGSGEFIGVLNGVEFRTRHNDYQLVQPETIDNTSDKIPYDAVEGIPFPDVPPEVTSQETIRGQIQEMREWFKAWRDQDHSVRDYRPYFKPVLCILEGGWTVTNGTAVDQPFDTPRHFVNAKSWHHLQDKIRFTAFNGRKHPKENIAYLPSAIISMENGTFNLAQWNYRIFCHPLKRDLSTKRLIPIDDITSRIAFGRSMEQHTESRAARFRLMPEDKDEWTEKLIKSDLLDELMAEIPGKDGYGNELLDTWLDGRAALDFKTPGNLSAGYYHRWFKGRRGAKAVFAQHRGFSDENLFMAMTTQEKIAPISVESCITRDQNQSCPFLTHRWTSAVPLEIIYMTPLQRWNPYNIDYKESQELATTAKRWNGRSEERALNGSHHLAYHHTPVEFFVPDSRSKGPADSGRFPLWIRDSNGVPREVEPSGVWIHLPEIEGVGQLRTRYPIMPLHYEGSAAWKELTALKDIILKPKQHSHMFYQNNLVKEEPVIVTLMMKASRSRNSQPHMHLVYVNRKDLEDLTEKRVPAINVISEEGSGHSHSLTLRAIGGKFVYTECDGEKDCWDKHPRSLDIANS